MAKKKSALRVIPLGGLDGIGKNMCVFELDDDMILVDAGLMFPDDSQLGVDLVLPDYTYVLQNEHKLRGILITHGHEDHTGALPYLLKDLNKKVSIFASKMTLALIKGKLEEHKLNAQKLVEVKSGQHIELGAFGINFFAMTHSIPGAMGIYMKTAQGTVMHTGDFKLDQTPIDGITPDYRSLVRYGEEGVDLLMSDSTNATLPGFTPSEATVGSDLRHIIKNAPGRVFVASFASHIHRLQQVCDAAVAVGRKIVVAGRSMVQNAQVAHDLGYLHVDERNIIDSYELKDLPDDKVVVLCTGSQGEPLSALARMASGDHKTLSIAKNDTVIISATPVPGNEKSVANIVNSLSKIGCKVYDKTNAHVHVSGHGSQEELKLVLSMVRPRYFAPVHGEALHLRAHADLAESLGMRPDHIFLLDNGDTLVMRNGEVRFGGTVESGVVYVDGMRVSDTDSVVLRDRKKLSEDGIVSCVVTVAIRSHACDEIDISARGVSFTVDEVLLEEASQCVREAVNAAAQHQGSTLERMQKKVRIALSKYLWEATHTKPMIIPVVMEV